MMDFQQFEQLHFQSPIDLKNLILHPIFFQRFVALREIKDINTIRTVILNFIFSSVSFWFQINSCIGMIFIFITDSDCNIFIVIVGIFKPNF